MEMEQLRAYSELFDTEGWKSVVREAQEEVEALKHAALEGAKDFNEVCYLRGQAHQLMRLVTLEDALIAMVTAEQEEEEDASV